jgi:hypothetical protein
VTVCVNIRMNSKINVLEQLNDLWKFDGSYWTWVSGRNQINAIGIYGEKGVPSQSNIPGARDGPLSWVDNEGSFWIFGGRGYNFGNSKITICYLNS